MFEFGSMFGNPWEGGFQPPQSFAPGVTNNPIAPPVDLAAQMAQGLASAGIRPGQFFANPQAAAPVLQPPGGTPDGNVWDPTPVDMPGGQPVSLGSRTAATEPRAAGQPSYTPEQESLSTQGMDASATGSSQDKKAGEKSSFDKFAEGLRGVQAPKPPDVVKPSTPGIVPPRGDIKTGELLAMLLAAASAGGGGGVKPATTLNASLKGAFG